MINRDLDWAVPLTEAGLSLTSATFTWSHAEDWVNWRQHLGGRDREPLRRMRKVPQEGGSGHAHSKKQFSVSSLAQISNSTIPDIWLHSPPAWSRVALSIFAFTRAVPSLNCPPGLLGRLPAAIGQNCTKERLNMTDILKVSLCPSLCYLLLAVEPGRPHRSHRVTGHTLRLTSRLLLKHSMEVFRDMDRAHVESSLTGGGKLPCCFRPA